MVDAGAVQAVLLGAGGFVGTSMAGIGAYRLCIGVARRFAEVPASIDRGVRALERTSAAIEGQAALLTQVVEMKQALATIHGDVQRLFSEQEGIHRTLRIFTRQAEGFTCSAAERG